MKGERDYVNFLKSFYEAAKNLNDEDRLNFYDSIYGETDQIEDVINDIRTYCIDNCSIEDGLKGIFDFINN